MTSAQPVVYRLVELGPANATITIAYGINEAGTVVGFANVQTPTGKESRAVRTVNDVFTSPAGLERSSLGLGINANGDITGSITTSPYPSYDYHAMRYTDAGGVEDLTPGLFGIKSEGLGINRYGNVAGWIAAGSGSHAFVSTTGGLRDLGTLGGPSATAYGINDAGTVVGTSTLIDGSQQAFVVPSGGSMRSLGIPVSEARRINNHEQIVGSLLTPERYSHPFRYTPGAGVEILDPYPFRNGQAYGINDRGDVVGSFQATNVFPHGFIYSEGEFVDLNTRIVAGGEGWTVTSAVAINENGEIAAHAVNVNIPYERAVKLVPIDVIQPVIESASADPSILWPPDGRMVPVAINVVATDDRDPSPHCSVETVAIVDESFEATDVELIGDLLLLVRAERSAHLSEGRAYIATVACTDASGNRATTTVTVAVPRDFGGEGHD